MVEITFKRFFLILWGLREQPIQLLQYAKMAKLSHVTIHQERRKIRGRSCAGHLRIKNHHVHKYRNQVNLRSIQHHDLNARIHTRIHVHKHHIRHIHGVQSEGRSAQPRFLCFFLRFMQVFQLRVNLLEWIKPNLSRPLR